MDNNLEKNETQNELNKKQVFIDLDTKPEASDKTIVIDADAVKSDLHRKTVFDEAYAAMKNARSAPAPVRRSSAVRTPSVSGGSRFRPNKLWNTRLVSGELPADALRRITRELPVLALFCLAVMFIFSVRGLILDYMTDADYSALAKGTSYSAAVGSMEIEFNENDLPDGFAAAQAVCRQLNIPITDSSVFENKRNAPIYPGKVLSAMESALGETAVTLKTNMSNLDLLVQIYQSLENNTPVIVLLSEKSGEGYTMQYAVVSHIDAEQNKITVCNPNSGTKDYTLEQFITASRFDNFEDMPFPVRTALAVGSWNRNTALFVDSTNE